MIDFNKPFRLVNKQGDIKLPRFAGSALGGGAFVTWGSDSSPHYWCCDETGAVRGHHAWTAENLPPEPVKHTYLVALIRVRDDVYPLTVLNQDALDRHMISHPGRVLSTKTIEMEYVPFEKALSKNSGFDSDPSYRGAY